LDCAVEHRQPYGRPGQLGATARRRAIAEVRRRWENRPLYVKPPGEPGRWVDRQTGEEVPDPNSQPA
jgi:hypothetical protein